MGVVKIGKSEYYGTKLKIVNGRLILGGMPILSELGYLIQIRGTDIDVERVFSSDNVLVEGNVGRCVVNRHLLVVGKVLKFFVPNRRYFFNNLASTEFRNERNSFTKKPENSKRVILNCSGHFSDIIVQNTKEGYKTEVWLRGNASYIKAENVLTVKGTVNSASADESMYVSKK